MAECIHFPDDPNASCSICTPRKPKETDPFDGGIRAKYYGKCDKCGGTIYEGDFIEPVSGQWGKWVHTNDCKGAT